ncbi:MAG: SH3 domain-containing protein [Candidatus Saccharicenans sp.]|nr:MAG: hypothetical protein C0168_00330 [Candidatus Aminicenantes bacterium]
MKKLSALGLTILMVFLFFSVAGSQTQKFRVRVVSEQANIRVKPDISSEMLLQVPEGTELEAEKKEGEWYLVLFEKSDGTRGQGYIHESLVEVVPQPKPVVANPPRSEKPTPKATSEPVRAQKNEESRPEVKAQRIIPRTPGIAAIKRLSLKVYGFGTYISPSMLNQAAEGVTDYYLGVLNYNGKANLSPLHFCFGYGFDLFYEFWPRLSLGLGFDYFQQSKVNPTAFTVGNVDYSVRTEIGVKDLPLRISLRYQPVDLFYFQLGIEYHLAKTDYHYLITQQVGSPLESWASWKGTASGKAWGWVEAAGYQWPLTSWFRIYIEGSYRSVRIKNFHGDNIYLDSDGWQNKESGDLYYWQVQVSPNVSYPVLFIRERLPSEPGVINPRKADLNYSGFGLRFGLDFKF